MRRSICLLPLVCGIAFTVGCGSSAPLLRGSITAEPTTNPDLRGRPSPVVVRVYELKSLAAFNTADGSLDSTFKPALNGRVRAVAVSSAGIYVGGDTMIEAPHTGAVVRYATIWRADLIVAGRP